ncbi:DUF1097 domain-containing protein [Halogeometricum sp. S1BR25-6]|uniref:DUF1097 domain-containing protein n=1 Tax=Halogeometricum salsisoli TaxID=2950536 RepID=A0ABU2GK48_9EURY|nr:DUF1097 domain-containing protein [Halogeometricum sp. S1BR25-6]MDS0300564.1 DUF1097 domain-containing protein [Halogeometricum sp. S1BR25-6]
MPEETPRVPLWLAVAITAFVSVPFGTLLGVYSIPVWASFIAWAEYFTFGSSPGQLKWIYGLFPLGAFTMAVFGTVNNYVVDVMGSTTSPRPRCCCSSWSPRRRTCSR